MRMSKTIASAITIVLSAVLLTAVAPVQYAPGVGTWEGSYRCGQTVRGLRLVVRTLGFDPTARQAHFIFWEDGGSATAPAGSYTMRGRMLNGRMELEPHEWVQRGRGYSMVGLDGTVSGAVYSGDVGGSCREFSLRRQGAYLLEPETQQPPA